MDHAPDPEFFTGHPEIRIRVPAPGNTHCVGRLGAAIDADLDFHAEAVHAETNDLVHGAAHGRPFELRPRSVLGAQNLDEPVSAPDAVEEPEGVPDVALAASVRPDDHGERPEQEPLVREVLEVDDAQGADHGTILFLRRWLPQLLEDPSRGGVWLQPNRGGAVFDTALRLPGVAMPERRIPAGKRRRSRERRLACCNSAGRVRWLKPLAAQKKNGIVPEVLPRDDGSRAIPGPGAREAQVADPIGGTALSALSACRPNGGILGGDGRLGNQTQDHSLQGRCVWGPPLGPNGALENPEDEGHRKPSGERTGCCRVPADGPEPVGRWKCVSP